MTAPDLSQAHPEPPTDDLRGKVIRAARSALDRGNRTGEGLPEEAPSRDSLRGLARPLRTPQAAFLRRWWRE